MNKSNVENNLVKLRRWFLNQKGVIVAFSGGIDSALVVVLAKKFLGKEKIIAVISNSESLKAKEFDAAKKFAKNQNIELKIIRTNEIDDKNYYSNPSNRCYFCKKHLYNGLMFFKLQYPDYTIVNGTNSDDYQDFRPGHKAAREFSVRSPLAECNIDKQSVRELARFLKLEIWNKPASPCLSSRIPYGEQITLYKLKNIEKAEEILNRYGFQQVRVRYYGIKCKIEVPIEQLVNLKKKIKYISDEIVAETSFKICEIDEEGLISGKLNRKILTEQKI